MPLVKSDREGSSAAPSEGVALPVYATLPTMVRVVVTVELERRRVEREPPAPEHVEAHAPGVVVKVDVRTRKENGKEDHT